MPAKKQTRNATSSQNSQNIKPVGNTGHTEQSGTETENDSDAVFLENPDTQQISLIPSTSKTSNKGQIKRTSTALSPPPSQNKKEKLDEFKVFIKSKNTGININKEAYKHPKQFYNEIKNTIGLKDPNNIYLNKDYIRVSCENQTQKKKY